MSLFSIGAGDSSSRARTGTLELPHGTVETPAFMPVGTNGTVKAMSPETLGRMGIELILANTYHLYLRPGIEVIEEAGGLHAFCSWRSNILTDSGGYQLFSLASLRKVTQGGVRFQSHIDGSSHELSPESVIDLQCRFGSDVCMPLDLCTPPRIGHEEAEKALEITLDWLGRSKTAWLGADQCPGTQLFGIVQGNFYEDLRKRAVAATADFDLPGIAIGGLSVGESFEEFSKYLGLVAAELPVEIPHYVMGIGTPDYILTAVQNGIDMFDCVLPTRTARNGQVFTRDGTINLKKEYNRLEMGPIDPDCTCTACIGHTRAYMRHLFKAKEILGIMLATEHNLQFMENLLADVRESIRQGRFLEFQRSFLLRYNREKS